MKIKLKKTTKREKDCIGIMLSYIGIFLLPYILPLWSLFLQFTLNIDKFFGV